MTNWLQYENASDFDLIREATAAAKGDLSVILLVRPVADTLAADCLHRSFDSCESSSCSKTRPPCPQCSRQDCLHSGLCLQSFKADWRGIAGYLVKFQIQDVLKLTVRQLDIPRTAEELSALDSQIRLKFPFSVPDSLVFPDTFSIDSLTAYINVLMTMNTL